MGAPGKRLSRTPSPPNPAPTPPADSYTAWAGSRLSGSCGEWTKPDIRTGYVTDIAYLAERRTILDSVRSCRAIMVSITGRVSDLQLRQAQGSPTVLNVRDRLERLVMRMSSSRRFDGRWLGVHGHGDRSYDGSLKRYDHLLDRLEPAILLVQHHAPLKHGQIHRDFERIWISTFFRVPVAFNRRCRTFYLNRDFVATYSPEIIASLMVFVATKAHPLLRKFGHPEALRQRIELICLRQQMAFAHRLQDGIAARELTEKLIARTRDTRFWAPDAVQTRRFNNKLWELRGLGVPEWAIRSLRALRNVWLSPSRDKT